MTDPSFTPPSGRELLAVYPDRDRAEAARVALLDAGVDEGKIRLQSDEDIAASLRSEQHDELSRAWVVPNAAVVYPAGSARGLGMLTIVGCAIGLAAAFPLALIDWGSTYWIRWLIWAAVGVGFGGVIALVVGPAGGAPLPGEQPAVARGVTLRVAEDSDQLRDLLADLDPVRIDEVDHEGSPIETVVREEPDTATQTLKDMAANARSDEFHPPENTDR